MKTINKPQEFWLDIATPYGDPYDFINLEDPYMKAKRTNTHAIVSATNIHVIEYYAYENLKAQLEIYEKIMPEVMERIETYGRNSHLGSPSEKVWYKLKDALTQIENMKDKN